jgi:hypothetical protein
LEQAERGGVANGGERIAEEVEGGAVRRGLAGEYRGQG